MPTLTALNGRVSEQGHAAAERPAGRKSRVPTDVAVYESIAAAIFEQRLPPGTKLTEDTLGSIFGVSRTLIRNALLRLAHDKIVEIRPNRGAIVASPTAEEAQHVFEARRVVEQAIVARAARHITRQQAARLLQLTEEERAAHERGDRRGWVRFSGAFHLELAEIAGNGVLADFLRELVSRTSLIIALREAPMNSACAAHEHREVLDAIAAGDGVQAITLMTRHLEAIERRLNLGEIAPGVDLREVFRDVAGGRAEKAPAPEPARGLRGAGKSSALKSSGRARLRTSASKSGRG